MFVAEMQSAHPEPGALGGDVLQSCIEACAACAQACTACAHGCLAEPGIVEELQTCVRRNLDCAGMGAALCRIAWRSGNANVQLLAAPINACALICRLCGDECGRHAAHHEHCRTGARACRSCADACSGAVRARHAA